MPRITWIMLRATQKLGTEVRSCMLRTAPDAPCMGRHRSREEAALLYGVYLLLSPRFLDTTGPDDHDPPVHTERDILEDGDIRFTSLTIVRTIRDYPHAHGGICDTIRHSFDAHNGSEKVHNGYCYSCENEIDLAGNVNRRTRSHTPCPTSEEMTFHGTISGSSIVTPTVVCPIAAI